MGYKEYIKIELLKNRRKYYLIIGIAIFIVSLFLDIPLYQANRDLHIKLEQEAYLYWLQVYAFYLQIFMPITIAFLVSIIYEDEFRNKNFDRLIILNVHVDKVIQYKSIVVFINIVLIYMVSFFLFLCCGILLNIPMQLQDILQYIFKIFISIIGCIGILGVQNYISVKSKSFIIPIAFSILGVIVNFIIQFINSEFLMFYPYAQPTIPTGYWEDQILTGERFILFVVLNIIVYLLMIKLTEKEIMKTYN